MLILARYIGESLILTTESGERIEVMVSEIERYRVRLAIVAPQSVRVVREEIEQERMAGQ